MEYSELFAESIEALTVNKLRTFLATLGIVIGIASVITLISLGQGSQKMVQSQIESLGSNLLTVMPGSQTSGGIRGAAGGGTSLTYSDAQAIATSPEVTTVKSVSPELSRRTQVTSGSSNTNTQVIGATYAYTQVRSITMAQGSFITQADNVSLAKVAVLGPTVVTDLFGENASSPVGSTIRINRIAFRIIGVTQSKGGSGFFNQDDIIFIPLSTAQKQVFGVDYLSSISVEADSDKVMTEAENQIGYLLLSRHNLSTPQQADFSIFSQADILGAATSVTGTFTALLSGIAAISLLVGGIGIMNIMLVSVIERTREIGLRKALGAKKQTVISQFLAESILVTSIGGIFGMLLGTLLSFVIAHFINIPFALSVTAVFLATAVSGLIGVIFGWYPARRAASLSPIEALRYE